MSNKEGNNKRVEAAVDSNTKHASHVKKQQQSFLCLFFR